MLYIDLLQVQRLSWHPSVALWCGNNELELSYEWPNNTIIRSNRNTFAHDYMVNINLLRKAVKKVKACTCQLAAIVGGFPLLLVALIDSTM
jgi:beta-galactosidase/beta-glucuronidase